MIVAIDNRTCDGCGLCAEVCPYIFSIELSGKAAAHHGMVPYHSEASCRDVARFCPADAIRINEKLPGFIQSEKDLVGQMEDNKDTFLF